MGNDALGNSAGSRDGDVGMYSLLHFRTLMMTQRQMVELTRDLLVYNDDFACGRNAICCSQAYNDIFSLCQFVPAPCAVRCGAMSKVKMEKTEAKKEVERMKSEWTEVDR